MTPVATETDVTTDDGAARVRRLPLMGVVLAGALLLSACGGSPDGDAQAGSEEPSASASSNKTDDGGSGEESSSAGGPSEGSGDDGSSEESSGESVPASSDGPAQNLPVPEAPDEITVNSEEGAEAAVRHWWDLLAYAKETGDTDPLAALSAEDCETCASQVDSITRVFEGDAWYANVHYEVDTSGVNMGQDGTASGPSFISSPPYDAYDTAGEHRGLEAMQDEMWHAELTYSRGHWTVDELAVFDDEATSEAP